MDIIGFNYFNLEKIQHNNYKYYEPDCLNVYLKYKKINNSISDLNFETPWLDFFCEKPVKDIIDLKKTYINLLFRNYDSNIKIIQFYNIINKIDNYIKYKNSFLDDFTGSDVNKFLNFNLFYIPSLKYYPNNKIVENSSLRLKIFPKHIKIYNIKNKKINLSNLSNECEVKATIQCHSIWLSKDNYGLTWIAKSLKIRQKRDLFKEALFS